MLDSLIGLSRHVERNFKNLSSCAIVDKQAIEEYGAKEKDETQRLLRKTERKLEKGGKLAVADFFPSLEGKLFSNYILEERLPTQLLFSTGLFVSVEPFKTSEMFYNHYGVSADELYDLAVSGIISPVINCGLWRYVDVDYLDDIFELEPPTYNRLTGFFSVLSNHKYSQFFSEGESLFRNKLSEVAKRKKWDIFYPDGLEAYETKASYDYARIKCLYPRLLRKIDFQNTVHAAEQILYYDELVVDAFTQAYEGIHKISLRKLKFQIPSVSGFEVFQSDIARALARNFRLEYPRDIGIDTLREIMKDPVVSKGKKAIADLDNAVQEFQDEKACERAIALKYVWRETCEAIDSLTKWRSRVEVTIASVGVAAVGTGSYLLTKSIPDTLGLSALAYAPLKSKVEALSTRIVRLRKPVHVSTCWDYGSKIRKIKERVHS